MPHWKSWSEYIKPENMEARRKQQSEVCARSNRARKGTKMSKEGAKRVSDLRHNGEKAAELDAKMAATIKRQYRENPELSRRRMEGGKVGSLAFQAKYIKAKLRLEQYGLVMEKYSRQSLEDALELLEALEG